MPPKYQPGRIKLAKLAPTTKPVAAPLEPCSADSIEMKAPNQGNSTVLDLLKNTAPRNIPRTVKERFQSLSQRSIMKMIRELSESVKSANGSDKRLFEVTLQALQELLKEKEQEH
jgi:hypothetical protein